jgi:hypothetical protein
MAKKTIIVCDICGSDSNVKAFEVKRKVEGDKTTAELCGTHAQPFNRIFQTEEAKA